jgi:lipopolysaccharide export system permease protein
VRTVQFREASLNEDFTAVPPPYRERGNSVRELTLPELRSAASDGEGVDATKRAGEFHGRVARTFLPLLLPLLALPLGMAAKRGRRAPGTVFAALALLALNQALQFGESMGETGRAPAWLAVWLPWAAFAVLGLWLFRSSLQWPGDNPVMRAVSFIEGAFEGMQRKKKAPAK